MTSADTLEAPMRALRVDAITKPVRLEPIRGWLYCLYNSCFTAYGPSVYKLGRTKNLKQRMAQYTTSYIEPSHFIHISSRAFEDSRKAEAVLFFLLRKYRVAENREFFSVPSSNIRYIMDRLSHLQDYTIDAIYKQILLRVCPDDVLNQYENTEEELTIYSNALEYNSWLEDFFNKFRFRPNDPSFYDRVGLRSAEEDELYALLSMTKQVQSKYSIQEGHD